jgi:hypothetical protein
MRVVSTEDMLIYSKIIKLHCILKGGKLKTMSKNFLSHKPK